MKTLTEFISAAFAVLIFALSAVTANAGSLTTPRPRPTPAPRPTPPLTADIGSSYSHSKVPYAIEGQEILEDLGYPFQDPAAVGYGDFNGDRIPDLVFGPGDGTMTGMPIVIALGQP